jgi:hypothetical protein
MRMLCVPITSHCLQHNVYYCELWMCEWPITAAAMQCFVITQ